MQTRVFRLINGKLLLVIFATLLIPSIYKTFRAFFIGTLPDTYAFSIAGNLNWIDVLFEILEESFLLPLFFILKRFKGSQHPNREITGKFYEITILYGLAIILFMIFEKQLIELMSVRIINQEVVDFVRIEFSTRFFIVLGKIAMIFLIAKTKGKQILYLLAGNVFLNIFLDLIIVSNYNFSLQKGVVGIAGDQLISSMLTSLVGMYFVIHHQKIKVKDISNPIGRIEKNTFSQNVYIGVESLIRNLFFIFFVIKTINRLPGIYNQGNFGVMNTFIGDGLLLPIIAISQYVNRAQALFSDNTSIKDRLFGPFVLVTIVIVIGLATMPSGKFFIKYILNNKDYITINRLAFISVGFYVLFAYNNIIDKFFIGGGNAKLLLIQSVFTSVVVYLPYYFFKQDVSLNDVAIMMGTAIAADSALTFVMFVWYIRRYKCNTK